tara:strand:+ start:322 stop:828 length:507 start_codon:yes stop_codon:yes gene_type:complete
VFTICYSEYVANYGYGHKPQKGFKMAKRSTARGNASTAQKSAVLQNTGSPVSYADIWAFVQAEAGGNVHNVQVLPLDNVKLDSDQPVPFGYTGKVGGVRATIQDWLLNGYKGDNSLFAILNAAKPLGHSTKSPICLLAMLNGGYTPSSSVYGTGYVKLVVQPQAKVTA